MIVKLPNAKVVTFEYEQTMTLFLFDFLFIYQFFFIMTTLVKSAC